MFPPFIPHPLVRGGHAQTVLGCYLPGLTWTAGGKRHLVSLPDGDQLVLHDDEPNDEAEWHAADRVALLVHGLGGSHQSTYMLRTAAKLVAKGVRVFRMDLRGCGAGTGLAMLPVHAGRSEDVGAALAHVIETCPDSPVFLVGFSMGANLVLKLLGELGLQRPANLAGALAVAPPIDLIACAQNMETGLNMLYNRKFLRNLLREAVLRSKRVPREFAPPLHPLPRHLRDFDKRFTAPLGGFESAEDYYHRASSAPLLKEIDAPTVVLAAADDPIVPVGPFAAASYSSSTQLVIVPSGGHLGFFAKKGADPDRRWLDWRIVDWVTTSSVPRIQRDANHSRKEPKPGLQMA
jgi:predicted alpha/beta-fold hydrolase